MAARSLISSAGPLIALTLTGRTRPGAAVLLSVLGTGTQLSFGGKTRVTPLSEEVAFVFVVASFGFEADAVDAGASIGGGGGGGGEALSLPEDLDKIIFGIP